MWLVLLPSHRVRWSLLSLVEAAHFGAGWLVGQEVVTIGNLCRFEGQAILENLFHATDHIR